MRRAALFAGPVLGVLAWFSLRRAAFLAASLLPPRDVPWLDAEALPSLALIVPARDEEAVLPRLLAALDGLDYPRDRLSVLLVSHGSVDSTAALFVDWAASRPFAHVLELTREGTKGTALNAGLAAADAELVGVVDADLSPRPDALRRLAGAFVDPGVDAAAALLHPANARASLVARYAAVDAWVHQLVTSAAKDRLGLDPPAFGASVYRRTALERIGGFASESFHEDLATAIALSASGGRTRFVAGAVFENWVVENIPDYLRQHDRWTRGPFDASRSRPRGLGQPLRQLEAITTCIGYGDRAAFCAATLLGAFRIVPRWVLAAYLALPAAEVVVAVTKASERHELPRFLGSTIMFPVDAVATLVAIAAHVRRRPRVWHARTTQRGGESRLVAEPRPQPAFGEAEHP